MSPRSPRTLLVVAALSAGCSLFKFNVSTPETRRQEQEARQQQADAARQQAEAAAQQAAAQDAEARAAREQELVTQLATMRGELTAAPTTARAIAFAGEVREAEGTQAAREGRIEPDKLRVEAAGFLERAIAGDPSYEGFTALAALAPSPEIDAAVRRTCPLVRPKLAADQVPDFVDVCLARAGGDPKAYRWPTLKADLAAHRRALDARARAEAEAARAAAEAERIAAEEAEAAAKAAATSGVFALAGVFAAGRCEFGDCMKNGWTTRTSAGDMRVRCNFSNCLKDGWTTELPGGGTARTRCEFGDCMKDGWTTELPGGGTARTRCNFSNCPKDGWTTELPDGGTARARCNFGDCFKDGWTTDMPDGSTVRCQCNFQKCLTDGTQCT